MLIVSVCALAALVVAAVLVARWWMWRPVVRRHVIVQLDDGASIEGVVTSRRGVLLVVESARVHVAGVSSAVDGRVVVERARVRWMQVI